MKFPFGKSLLSLLVAATLPAYAADYYVVVPLPAKTADSSAITVSLAPAMAPMGQVGVAYAGFDLRKNLTVTGDPKFTGYGVKWAVVGGSLPAGLTLNSNGTITGTPTAAGTSTFSVQASYMLKNGQQTYQVLTYQVVVALAGGNPPQAQVGHAYSYNLAPLLTVSGDPNFSSNGVTWSVVSSSLPSGLYLTSAGAIAGTPTAAGTGTIVARATYKGVSGQQTYQVVSLNISVALAAGSPPQAIVGQAYSYDLSSLLSVTGDAGFTASGVNWSVVSGTLPAGLSLTADGHISGTPTAAGTGTITAQAAYRGVNGQQTYQVVTLAIHVALAAGTPPQAIVGQAYSYNLVPLLAVSGDSAYTGTGVTWNVVSSSLPAGLYLTSDGRIAGTPTASGTGSITARASYRGVNGQQTYQVVTLAISVGLAAGAPPQAIVGQPYGYDLKQLLTVTGDSAYAGNGAGVTWNVVSSSLPAGLYLTSDGWIGGTPTAGGTGSITAQASYKGVNGQQTYQVVTIAVTVGLAAGSPPQAIVGQAYSYDLKPLLSVSGDSGYTGSGVTWSTVSSSLPAGLSLGANGTISGTPTAAGTGTITAQASYKGVNGQQTYQVVTLNISVTLAAGSPPQAIVGQAYSYALAPLLSVSGDSSYSGTGVTWNVVSSSLPAGLYLTSDGHIAGTPTAAGTGTLTAQASYRGVNGQQAYQVVSLNIVVSLAGATLPIGVTNNGYAGYDFKTALSVTGDSSYTPSAATWSVVSGALPPGLSLSSTGVLSGTPTTAAVSSFTLQAAYRNQTARTAYSLEVDAASVPGSLTAATSTDFGSVVVGSSAARSFTFTNNGNTAATGLYASVSGTALSLSSSSCGTAGAPVTLAKGASCSFTATFTPTTAGANSGTVAANWTGPTSSSKSLTVTDAATVNYSSLMNGFGTANVAIGTNAAWQTSLPWYWLSAGAESSAAPGTFEFRRSITIGGTTPVTAYLYGAVDDALTSMSVNGSLVASNLSMPFSGVNSTPAFTLQPGVNVIAVKVTNAGTAANPAGISLQVKQSNGALLGDVNGWFHQ
ncbi:TPA: putative Ig domain-containing protein [Burkholderia vietnamiensis]|nr:putative Ig domain-containing protein [Burkholderia vietnamiensis]